MKPSKQAIKAAEKYYRLEAEHDCFLGRRDQLATIIQAAIDEAYANGYLHGKEAGKRVSSDNVAAEWEKRYTELEARLMRSQHNHAEAVKELQQAYQQINEDATEAHKIKAEDTPA